MARRIKLADLNETVLANVESISAVDPNVPDYYKQVWTQTTATDMVRDAEAVPPLAAPNILEVELDSAIPDQLLTLKAMVDSAKEPFLENTWDLKD